MNITLKINGIERARIYRLRRLNEKEIKIVEGK